MERKKEIYQILRNIAKGVVIYFLQTLALMEKEKKCSFLFLLKVIQLKIGLHFIESYR